MKPFLFMYILTALLFHYCSSYSLEGRWNIKPQYLPKDVNASLTFQKQLNETDSRIVYYMNVFACRLMRYKYIVVDNEIYLTFDQFVTDRYTCQVNQVNFIRNKLQKVFFFYIVGTQLAMYGANGQAQFQLSRVPVPIPKNFSGEWLTVDVNGVSLSESISASESSFELCEGNGVVQYFIPTNSNNQVNFTVQKVSGCSQNEIFSTLNKVKYFRWKSSILLYFYDQNFEQIMTVRKIGQRISTSQVTKASQNSTILAQNETKLNPLPINSSSNIETNQNKNQSTTVTIQPQFTTSASTTKIPEVNATSNFSNQLSQTNVSQNNTKPIIESTNSSTTTSISVVPKSSDQQSNSSQSKPVIELTPKASDVSNVPQTYKSVADLPAISSAQLAGKWIINNKDYYSQTYKYFFLIVGDRITLYGDCNVYVTTFTLANSTLDKINIRTITSSSSANPGINCDQSKARILPLVQKWKQWKYLAISQNTGKTNVNILDSNFALLNTIEKI